MGTGYGPQAGISYLIGVDDGTDDVVRLEISAGDFADLSAPGTVMLHEDFATEEGLAVGDPFPIEFPDGALVDLEVVALFGADLFQTQVVISLDSFTTHYEWNLDQMVMVLLADGVDPEAARPALEAVVADYPNAKLNNAEEYIDEVASQLDLLLNVLTGMLAMAIVIALLGIANTLALSIMERKREIGLLRAVGMTRRQVRRMIRWEAVLIAVFGAVIGMVVGVGLGVAVVAAIGSGITLALPWANLALYLVAAALGGIVASIVPGWRGSRLDVLDAIAYEWASLTAGPARPPRAPSTALGPRPRRSGRARLADGRPARSVVLRVRAVPQAGAAAQGGDELQGPVHQQVVMSPGDRDHRRLRAHHLGGVGGDVGGDDGAVLPWMRARRQRAWASRSPIGWRGRRKTAG